MSKRFEVRASWLLVLALVACGVGPLTLGVNLLRASQPDPCDTYAKNMACPGETTGPMCRARPNGGCNGQTEKRIFSGDFECFTTTQANWNKTCQPVEGFDGAVATELCTETYNCKQLKNSTICSFEPNPASSTEHPVYTTVDCPPPCVGDGCAS